MELKPPANDLKLCYDDVLSSAEQAANDPVALGALRRPLKRSLAVSAYKSHCEVG